MEENTLELGGIPPALLTSSDVSLLCVAGNMFHMREIEDLPEYQQVRVQKAATILCYVRVYSLWSHVTL